MSSDSSDNEDLELLREAQDTHFLKEILYSGDKSSVSLKVKDQPNSLRIHKDENEQFNYLKLSAKYRNFVSKHLIKILDKKLESKLDYDARVREVKKKGKSGGIRLFSHSEKLVTVEHITSSSNTNSIDLNVVPMQKFAVTKGDLKNLTVSGEDILLKKDTEHWSSRSKSKIFTYVKISTESTGPATKILLAEKLK